MSHWNNGLRGVHLSMATLQQVIWVPIITWRPFIILWHWEIVYSPWFWIASVIGFLWESKGKVHVVNTDCHIANHDTCNYCYCKDFLWLGTSARFYLDCLLRAAPPNHAIWRTFNLVITFFNPLLNSFRTFIYFPHYYFGGKGFFVQSFMEKEAP